MLSKTITINAKTGMHARPASELTAFTKKFKCKVLLQSGSKTADCASIISILALGLKCGTEVNLVVEGEDEATALPAIAEFIESLEN